MTANTNTNGTTTPRARRTRKPASTTPETVEFIAGQVAKLDDASEHATAEVLAKAMAAGEDTIVTGVVVTGTPESRRADVRRYLSESDDSQVSAARVLSEIWFNRDWEDAGDDATLATYMADLGVGAESDHQLSRKARGELVTLLRTADAEMPTTREFSALTGASQSSAARDLNAALDSNASRNTPELESGEGDGDDSEPADDKPATASIKVAKDDATRAREILALAGITVL